MSYKPASGHDGCSISSTDLQTSIQVHRSQSPKGLQAVRPPVDTSPKMAEVAGLVLGSVALVPLIKNVHNLYDSIKDAPKALQQYQVSTSRLLDTLEVIHTVSKTYNVFPENSRPWLAFHSYLADINNSCMELENLLKEKMKAEGKQIGTCKRVLWALLGRDEKAKELMNKIDRTARSLHLLFNAMTSMANSTMHDAHAAQLTISTNAWVTSRENIASILDDVEAIKTILEGVRADTMMRGITTVAETARIINEDSPTEDDALGPPEGGSSTIIYRRHAYQPIEKKSGYYIGGKTFLRHEKLTAFLLKTQSTGRQSGVIIQSKYEIKVKLSSKFLGYNFHINIGLDIGARSLCPKFGLYYRRVIPESDLQYYYVKNHMFEEFRDLVVQGRASIYDLYDFKYEFCSTSSVIQFLGSHIEFGATPQGRNRTYEFVTFLLQEGYKPDSQKRMSASNWAFLWSSEYMIESELAADSFYLVVIFQLYDDPLVVMMMAMLKTDGIWNSDTLSFNTLCNILRRINEETALEFLKRILPRIERQSQWDDSKRYSTLLAALFCGAFNILVFLLHRGYPFRETAEFCHYSDSPRIGYGEWYYFDRQCEHISNILAIPTAAVIATALGGRPQTVWERSLKTVFPEIEVEKIFAEDCQKLPVKIRFLFAVCWNCEFRRSFRPLYGFCEKKGGISFKPYKSHGLPDSRYTKAIPKQCDDCDFATVECPNCGEIPLEFQGEEVSESTSDEDDQLPIPDSTIHLVSSDPQIEGLGVKLLAWSKFYLQRLGASGILITVLSAAVSYLLYKLKQSENMRRSMLVYSEELGPGE
ncbi:hypothetical protein TWF102_003481 [Orbilia oligospora]|uniref:Fungal N-terminal domain-containing protein n=1 Tax=Orbilia oligospora TaxID=2813651 RepID=A0A7C8N2H8_ORBOL|nr:hypothetical protein TWF102_003481 [Orbilia oligospora]KAF3081671.1 hypothetical protein TWF103_003670 [Orbilia oligospora]